MKRVAVNTRLLIEDKIDGIGLFTFETLKKIVSSHPEIEFYFIFDRKPNPKYLFSDNIHPIVVLPQTRHIYLFRFWFQYALKRALNKIKPDIFIATDGMFPLKTKIKTLAVIHDLSFEHHPEHSPKNVIKYYHKYFPKFAHQANRIATVSEFSKQDICKTYQIEDAKIDVVYNGPNENFIPLTTSEQTRIKEQYTDGYDYFLFVGTLHPRKNLINLFKAFEVFKTTTKSPKKLLIVGRKMWWTPEIENTLNNLSVKNDVLFAGRVSEQELYKITASAYALTYVPIFEGFGIPLVEAMSCGTPVISSNITSMPEVVGDAGILVNPFSVDEIAHAMVRMNDEHCLRGNLSEKSLVQAQKFSWQKTADLLWDSIQKTVHS
jgi:glycosyltransferase involved in cell wall biosynthesis